MFNSSNLSKIISLFIAVVFIAGIVHLASPNITETFSVEEIIENITPGEKEDEVPKIPARTGKHVLVHLDKMVIELHDGTTTLSTMPIVAQGPQGKYYETIGGEYIHDYKIRNHFSSIGEVYMPYSVHIFGNFFIHGIPYYPNGTKVDSTYSGGCVRLADNDAKAVYDFVEKGTPIIITRGGENDFVASSTTTPNIEDMDMTRLMVATISLDVLSQDNEILDLDRETLTTRRKILTKLLVKKEDRVSHLFAQALGEKTYLEYMNAKAKAMGLTNTTFSSLDTPVLTSKEDQIRFYQYINTYKSFLNLYTTEDTWLDTLSNS